MVQPQSSDPSFNPQLEQLVLDILKIRNADKTIAVSAETLNIWTQCLLAGLSFDLNNLVHNQTRILGIARLLWEGGIRLSVSDNKKPQVVLDESLYAVSAQNGDAASYLINIRFAFNVLTKGVQDALVQYAADLTSPSVGRANVALNTAIMQQLPWMASLTPETADRIAANVKFDAYDVRQDTEICLVRTLWALNFKSQQAFDTQSLIATRMVVPWMRELLKREDYSTALYLENTLYANFIRRKEEEQHYQEVYRLWAPMMEKAGRDLRAKLGPPSPVIKPGEKPVVGILIHQASMLAHIEVLYTSLKGIENISALPYRMILYSWSGRDAAMVKAFSDLGIEIVSVADLYPIELPFLDRLLGLRKKMETDGVQLLLWMCQMQMKGFAMGMGLAPRQIYWSVKYQVGAFDTPDDRIYYHDTGDTPVTIDGKDWKSVPMTFPSRQHTLDQGKLAELRKSFSGWKTILGSMAREDILNSPPYIRTVARILKNNPDAVYFYTGRENHPGIQAIFKEEGVDKQTAYVGWVDPVLYANLVDVYLDSWPARSGLTAFSAFEAGRAFVSTILKDGGAIHRQILSVMMNHEADGLHMGVKDIDAKFDHIDNNARFFPFVENADDYIKVAQRLIDDVDLREKIGATFKNFAAYLTDATRAGSKLDMILRDNLKQTGAL